MEQNLSLSPAQIQYLKIGPKVGTSSTNTKELQQSLDKFEGDQADAATSLSGISKFTYGNFQRTVNHFGTLLHRNFVGTTKFHQAEKYGKLAVTIDQVMQDQKDKPADSRKTGERKTFFDSRTSLKGIYEHKGHKLLVTLKSFLIESLQTHRIIETLPLAYLRLITCHVNSAKLVKSVEGAMRAEGGSMVFIEYQKIESKVSGFHNNEQKYGEGPFIFERSGQQFCIKVPVVQIFHSESDYRASCKVSNRDILATLDSDFDNVDEIVSKYADFKTFERHIQQGQVMEKGSKRQKTQQKKTYQQTVIETPGQLKEEQNDTPEEDQRMTPKQQIEEETPKEEDKQIHKEEEISKPPEQEEVTPKEEKEKVFVPKQEEEKVIPLEEVKQTVKEETSAPKEEETTLKEEVKLTTEEPEKQTPKEDRQVPKEVETVAPKEVDAQKTKEEETVTPKEQQTNLTPHQS